VEGLASKFEDLSLVGVDKDHKWEMKFESLSNTIKNFLKHSSHQKQNTLQLTIEAPDLESLAKKIVLTGRIEEVLRKIKLQDFFGQVFSLKIDKIGAFLNRNPYDEKFVLKILSELEFHDNIYTFAFLLFYVRASWLDYKQKKPDSTGKRKKRKKKKKKIVIARF